VDLCSFFILYMSFIYFLFMFFGGLALVVYREKVQRFFGDFPLAEQWLGAGGTFTFILLVGLFVMVGSIFWITGVLDFVVQGTIGRVFITPK
jgi:hypothetical protein